MNRKRDRHSNDDEPVTDDRIVVACAGYWVESVPVQCEGCGKGIYRDFASHGGDMFDPEVPPQCRQCWDRAMAARPNPLTDYNDTDDLPF